MKTKVIMFIIVLWVMDFFPCQAFELNVDTLTIVSAESNIEEHIIITIENTEKEPIWIWFCNTDNSQDDSSVIREHLMKRRGDFSLFDIATDPNMEGELWSMPITLELFFDLFVKYLKPRHSFNILVRNSEKDSLPLNKLIKVYSQKQIFDNCKGMETSWEIERITYPYNAVLLPEEKE